jgi:hypothetical protein
VVTTKAMVVRTTHTRSVAITVLLEKCFLPSSEFPGELKQAIFSMRSIYERYV